MQTLALDIVSQSSIDEAVAAVDRLTGGRLDLLINNVSLTHSRKIPNGIQAGILGTSAALDTDPDRMTAMFDVNVIGTLRMVQAFAPALAKTAGGKYRSKILNIGSVISTGAPWRTGYASTKVSPDL